MQSGKVLEEHVEEEILPWQVLENTVGCGSWEVRKMSDKLPVVFECDNFMQKVWLVQAEVAMGVWKTNKGK